MAKLIDQRKFDQDKSLKAVGNRKPDDQIKNPRKPWTIRYFHEGRQRERSFATEKEATDFKAKFEHDSRESIFVDPKLGRVDFVAYAGNWVAALDRTPGTKKAYRSVLNSQVKPAFDGRSLADVASDREGVWALVSNMTVKGKPASRSRRSMALTVIVGACTEAVRAGKVAKHRLDGLSIESDAIQQAVIVPASFGQLETLADGLRPDLHLTVWLMRGCGLRISEALAVNLRGFRENGRTLRVSEQVSPDGSLGPLKARKRGEYRDVPVPGWLWERIQAHVAEFGADDGYLFGRNGKRVTYNAQHGRFSKAAADAGLADMTEHGLRHLYVSTLLNAGVPITDVATWVGHRDIRVTHAVYGHLLPDSWTRGRQALEALAA